MGVAMQLNGSAAFAQSRDYALPGNQDYYAPRTTVEQVQTITNVELYHLGPGVDAMSKGRYLQALADFEFILRYYPNHPKVLGLVAEMCRKFKPKDCPAEGWFKKAVDRNPNAAPTFLLYAFHLHKEGRVKESVALYQRYIELEPNSVNGHYNLGLAYMALGQYDLANEEAQRSYRLGATLPGLRHGLEKRGKWNPAVQPAVADVRPAPRSSAESEPPTEADTANK